ncbi:hypothetical protein ABZ092_34610 [Streptomyces bobili]
MDLAHQHSPAEMEWGPWTGVHHHFLQGVAYKLGSGAVTLLILWWETRH